MNINKTLLFAAFLTVLVAFTPVARADDGSSSRYFVHTINGFWKNTLGVRNSFRDGFTADLSGFQLKLTQIAGLEIDPVKQLNILSTLESQDMASESKDGPSPRITPEIRIPEGIEMIYNDSSIIETTGGEGVNVAVLDTGVANHLDLKDRLVECKDFTGNKAVLDGKCDDKNGHGTHVAGIILADGGSDNKGIYGIASEANLFAYKVCSANGSCWSDDIASAIYTAADDGANIINLSLGSDALSSLISDAIDYAASQGVLVIAAAGNDGPYIDSIDFPGSLASVVAVGAIDSSSNSPDWSSRGGNSLAVPYDVQEKDIEFAAPGVGILSTWKDGGYAILSGTSVAAAHIAGLAAKLWQAGAAEPSTATRNLLHNISHDIAPLGDDDISGFGLPTL